MIKDFGAESGGQGEVPVLYFLGSSVTYGFATDGFSFVEEIAAKRNCVCVKNAVNGTTLACNGDSSYVSRLIAVPEPKIRRLFVQLSTNDVSQKTDLGKIVGKNGLIDRTTTLGAIETIILYAKKRWNCGVTFFTNPYYGNADYERLIGSLYEIREIWQIGILDFYHYRNMTALSRETLRSYMSDEIHPNSAGYRWMGEVFCAYLDALTREKP